MSGGKDTWVTPENAEAYRQAAADLDAHVPHYVDDAGRSHSVVGNADLKWTGASGETDAAQTAAHNANLANHGGATQQMANTLRATADHIDATNAASQALSSQRASDYANATSPADQVAANQSYLRGLSNLQDQYANGLNDLNGRLAAPRTELSNSGLPQTAQADGLSEVMKPSRAPAGTGVTPGEAKPPGIGTPNGTPRAFAGVNLGEKLAAYRGGGAAAVSTTGMGAVVNETPAQAATTQPQRGGKVIPAPAAIPLVAEADEQKRKPKPLSGLPASLAMSHGVLACLVNEFRRVGWDTPLAVVVVKQGDERQVVFATGDGLSVWPRGVRVPAQVLPLDYIHDLDPELAVAYQGYKLPAAKLVTLLESTQWEVEMVSTTVLNEANGENVIGLDDVELHRILDADAAAYPSVSRSAMAKANSAQTGEQAMKLRFEWKLIDIPLDEKVTAETLRRARWDETEQPEDYLQTYARWLLSDAVKCRTPEDTAYPLGVLLHLKTPLT